MASSEVKNLPSSRALGKRMFGPDGVTRSCRKDSANELPALNAVAVFQMGGLDPQAVDKGAVRRTQIAKKSLWRCYLEDAVMAREKSIMRQAKLCVFASPDHKSVVLIKCEVASGLWARHDV